MSYVVIKTDVDNLEKVLNESFTDAKVLQIISINFAVWIIAELFVIRLPELLPGVLPVEVIEEVPPIVDVPPVEVIEEVSPIVDVPPVDVKNPNEISAEPQPESLSDQVRKQIETLIESLQNGKKVLKADEINSLIAQLKELL